MAIGKGRDQQREAYWRRTIQEQRGSGRTIRDFCHKRKLRESAFHFWRRELERRQVEQRQGLKQRHAPRSRRGPRAPAFVPVHLAEHAQPPPVGRIEIVLSAGRRIRLTAPVDRQALADVLAVLEARPC